jgi:hypothetical protein
MASEANNVTLSTNFNVAPYYDDFDESKNFHRILFRPGLAVQARELTQMQTIFQNQIDRFASHIFQEGSTVRGLEMYYDTDYNYVKLRDDSSTGTTVDVTNFSDTIVKGATSGVLARVINVNDGSEANTPKLLVDRYIQQTQSHLLKVVQLVVAQLLRSRLVLCSQKITLFVFLNKQLSSVSMTFKDQLALVLT